MLKVDSPDQKRSKGGVFFQVIKRKYFNVYKDLSKEKKALLNEVKAKMGQTLKKIQKGGSNSSGSSSSSCIIFSSSNSSSSNSTKNNNKKGTTNDNDNNNDNNESDDRNNVNNYNGNNSEVISEWKSRQTDTASLAVDRIL